MDVLRYSGTWQSLSRLNYLTPPLIISISQGSYLKKRSFFSPVVDDATASGLWWILTGYFGILYIYIYCICRFTDDLEIIALRVFNPMMVWWTVWDLTSFGHQTSDQSGDGGQVVSVLRARPDHLNLGFLWLTAALKEPTVHLFTLLSMEKNEICEARIQSVTWERKASCQETQGLLFYCTDTDTDHIVVHIS